MTTPCRADATNPPDVPPGAVDAVFRVALETVDPSWSEPAESALADAVALMPGAMLTSVDCRTTICELRITFFDPVDVRYVRALFRELRPWRSYFLGGPTPSDAQQYVLFVARDGFRLDGQPATITDERPDRLWCE